MDHGSRMANQTGVALASKTSMRVRARMHPYCFWRDMLLFHSRQRKRMHGIRPNPRPEGRGEGDYECDELSTLSLRISRPFKRRRKGRSRGGGLEAPRNKWKVISMNNAGGPLPQSLRPPPSGDDERKLPYFRAISKKQKNMPRRAPWKKLYIEIGLYSCALCSAELRCPTLPHV